MALGGRTCGPQNTTKILMKIRGKNIIWCILGAMESPDNGHVSVVKIGLGELVLKIELCFASGKY